MARVIRRPRAYVMSQFAMVWAVLVIGYVGAALIRLPVAITRSRWLPTVLIVLLVLVGPVRMTINTLTLLPMMQLHAAEWDARDSVLRVAAEQEAEGVIRVPAFTVDLAASNGLDTVDDTPDTGFNVCAADYYRVDGIAVAVGE